MEWCGVTYEVRGTKEQLDRIQEDLQALPYTQAPSGASLCSHRALIETYFPLDRKERYVGEISFGRIDETRMVINDINNYDGFSLKPALAERYGTLTFRSVMEFSPGGPAAYRREYPLETVTPSDARRMRAEEEDKSENNSVFNLNDTLSFVSSEKKNLNDRFTKLESMSPSKKDSLKSKSNNRKP